MATTAKTYAKLGLFATLAALGVVVAGAGLGLCGLHQDTITYHTYFDEAVDGLDVGAPVKYRGVAVGKVVRVAVAPDRRHVDASLALRMVDVRPLGLANGPGASIPADLRTQLGSQGITGVKFISIDFFDPKTNPARPLPFADARTIPAAVSLMKDLQDSLVKALDRLPVLLDGAVASLDHIDRFLADLQSHQLPKEIATTVGNLDGAVRDLRQLLRHVDQARIPDRAALAIDRLDEAMAKVSTVLDALGGDGGFVASARRATDSVGDLGRSAAGSTADLDLTLRDVGNAARAVRELADAISHDPDMLVKGRASGRRP